MNKFTEENINYIHNISKVSESFTSFIQDRYRIFIELKVVMSNVTELKYLTNQFLFGGLLRGS